MRMAVQSRARRDFGRFGSAIRANGAYNRIRSTLGM
jgi:hypothetical protein